MQDTLRIGFLGTGWIASTYAKGLAELGGNRVVALCNHHLAKAEKFNADFADGAARCYDDFDRMLAEQPLDALYICLPPGAHAGQAERAAARGIHLVLEKPIALTIERAESIRAAVRAAGVQCQIGHHMRHTPPVRKLKQMLDDGSAGRPVLMQARFFANEMFPAWWRSPTMGGGQLVEQSIHLYDLARHLFGEPAAAAGFRDNLVHTRFPDYRVDDVSAATVRFRNGALASVCASNCWEPGAGSVEFSVQCEKVLARFASPDRAEFVHHGGMKPHEVRESGAEVRRETVAGGGHYQELSRNFLEAVRGREATRSTVDDGVESLRLVLAVAESSARGGVPQAT